MQRPSPSTLRAPGPRVRGLMRKWEMGKRQVHAAAVLKRTPQARVGMGCHTGPFALLRTLGPSEAS